MPYIAHENIDAFVIQVGIIAVLIILGVIADYFLVD